MKNRPNYEIIPHSTFLTTVLLGLSWIAIGIQPARSDEPEIKLDIAGHHTGQMRNVYQRLVDEGVVPADFFTLVAQLNEEAKGRISELKAAYVEAGKPLREAQLDIERTMPEEEFRKLAVAHAEAVNAFDMAGIEVQHRQFAGLPEKVKADLIAGKYSDYLPEPKVFKSKKDPYWMEKRTNRAEGYTAEQQAKWDEIHQAYLTALARCREETWQPKQAERQAKLFRALLLGDLDLAREAQEIGVTIRIEQAMMKYRQLREMIALLTDEQKATILAGQAKARERARKRAEASAEKKE